MLQRATTGASGGGMEIEEFTASVTSAQTQIVTTSKKANGIAFQYIAGGANRFCFAVDGWNDNYLNVSGTNYTKVTFNNNNITLAAGLGANLNITGIIMY